MNKKLVFALCCLIVLVFTGCSPETPATLSLPVSEPAHWPTQAWRQAVPEEQGIESVLLAQALERSVTERMRLHSLLVVRGGDMVAEAYYHPYTAETKMHVQSITKSVIGMLVGIAMGDGLLEDANQKVLNFFGDDEIANNSKAKRQITLANLLAMNSGLGCKVFAPNGPWMEDAEDWTQFILNLEMDANPGEVFNYCNENPHLLSAILTQVTGMSAREYANQRLFAPLGIAPVSEEDWFSDPQGNSMGGYGLRITPSDLAKLALLMLNNGQWEGEQIIPADWVAASTAQHSDKGNGSGYGYLWTVYPDEGHYAALGLGGQQIHVFPAQNLVVTLTADLQAFAESQSFETLLDEYILPAVKSDEPLTANAEGAARLQQVLAEIAYPLRPVAELPETAHAITGNTYLLEENEFGWQQIRLTFEDGSSTATIQLDPVPVVEVGLDNIYRKTPAGPGMEMLLRGRWLLKDTFILDFPYPFNGYMQLGELGESEMRFIFEGDQIEIVVQQTVFGGDPVSVHGARVN